MTTGTVVLAYHHFRTPGGDAALFDAEARLLRRNGWRVVTVTDATPSTLRVGERLALGANAVWSRRWHRRSHALMRRIRPDVVHVHNVFPGMSPSILPAAREAGAKVVMTLHDLRLVCPNALCFRDGAPCEDCVGRPVAWPALVHGCYRGSRVETTAPVAMLAVHRALGTWDRAVDGFVAPSRFQRERLVRGGLPADRIRVVPNFVDPDPGPRRGTGSYCLFLGNLTEHKGVRTMLDAWSGLGREVPLKVAGTFPSGRERATLFREVPGVEWLGRRSRDEVVRLLRGARLLLVPSRWHEVAPMAVLEAFAVGVPVVASRTGSLAELLRDGDDGVLFEPGDPMDLAAAVRSVWDDPATAERMGCEARGAFERGYTAASHYEALCEVYRG